MKTKFVATNMDRKKSLLAELMKIMLTRINQQILTCIQNKEGIRSDLIFPFFNEPLALDMHVQKEKYENFVSMSPFTGRSKCAAQKLKKTFAVLVYV